MPRRSTAGRTDTAGRTMFLRSLSQSKRDKTRSITAVGRRRKKEKAYPSIPQTLRLGRPCFNRDRSAVRVRIHKFALGHPPAVACGAVGEVIWERV